MQSNLKMILGLRCHKCQKSSASLLYQNLRSIHIKSRTQTHYDNLGVSPGATQGEIKSAYYKLSKIYHPDTNEGSKEASEKFRIITEAYEV
jgi:DnaJ-class molecular chaperone